MTEPPIGNFAWHKLHYQYTFDICSPLFLIIFIAAARRSSQHHRTPRTAEPRPRAFSFRDSLCCVQVHIIFSDLCVHIFHQRFLPSKTQSSFTIVRSVWDFVDFRVRCHASGFINSAILLWSVVVVYNYSCCLLCSLSSLVCCVFPKLSQIKTIAGPSHHCCFTISRLPAAAATRIFYSVVAHHYFA